MSILSNQFNLSYFQVLVVGRGGLAANSFNSTIFHLGRLEQSWIHVILVVSFLCVFYVGWMVSWTCSDPNCLSLKLRHTIAVFIGALTAASLLIMRFIIHESPLKRRVRVYLDTELYFCLSLSKRQ